VEIRTLTRAWQFTLRFSDFGDILFFFFFCFFFFCTPHYRTQMIVTM